MDGTAEIMTVENDCPLKVQSINCSKNVFLLISDTVLQCYRYCSWWFSMSFGPLPSQHKAFVCFYWMISSGVQRCCTSSVPVIAATTISFVSVFCDMIGYFTKSYSAFPLTQCCTILILIGALAGDWTLNWVSNAGQETTSSERSVPEVIPTGLRKVFIPDLTFLWFWLTRHTQVYTRSTCFKRVRLCESYLLVMRRSALTVGDNDKLWSLIVF